MADPADTLDAQVRAADPDRWLSSRFVGDPVARADLIALYAFEAELLAIPTRVTQPLLAEMRYRWWGDQLDGVFAGEGRKGHPVLEAVTAAVARHDLPRAPFEALIEAHIGRVHGAPHDLDAFYAGPMTLAAMLLGVRDPAGHIGPAAAVWGLSQTGRADEARAGRRAANRALRSLPPRAFPAVAHASLVRRDAPEAAKRLRLIWAMARGRV